jgi:hypothetical protein
MITLVIAMTTFVVGFVAGLAVVAWLFPEWQSWHP